jgi:hypothetical protein
MCDFVDYEVIKMILYYYICNFPFHFIKDGLLLDDTLMIGNLRILENLFNEKLRVLETAYDNLNTENINMKKEITNLKTENINTKKEITKMKKENINDKIEISNMKKEIAFVKTENNNVKATYINDKGLEGYVCIPLSVVEGSDRSRYTLANDSVLFNANDWCSVFLDTIIEKVFFFFFFLFFFLQLFV